MTSSFWPGASVSGWEMGMTVEPQPAAPRISFSTPNIGLFDRIANPSGTDDESGSGSRQAKNSCYLNSL
jgi:hypothetical protein